MSSFVYAESDKTADDKSSKKEDNKNAEVLTKKEKEQQLRDEIKALQVQVNKTDGYKEKKILRNEIKAIRKTIKELKFKHTYGTSKKKG